MISNKEYFIDMATVVARKSKDPSTQVGCVIVDPENRVVSCGYNGFIQGCNEKLLSWEDRPMKLLYVIHAEDNAILFAKRDLKNHVAYVTHGPCENCLKRLLQAGIREIYYRSANVIKLRGSLDQKEAIKNMIAATGAIVENINGASYTNEIYYKLEDGSCQM